MKTVLSFISSYFIQIINKCSRIFEKFRDMGESDSFLIKFLVLVAYLNISALSSTEPFLTQILPSRLTIVLVSTESVIAIAFGLLSIATSVIGVVIGYLTLRAMSVGNCSSRTYSSSLQLFFSHPSRLFPYLSLS